MLGTMKSVMIAVFLHFYICLLLKKAIDKGKKTSNRRNSLQRRQSILTFYAPQFLYVRFETKIFCSLCHLYIFSFFFIFFCIFPIFVLPSPFPSIRNRLPILFSTQTIHSVFPKIVYELLFARMTSHCRVQRGVSPLSNVQSFISPLYNGEGDSPLVGGGCLNTREAARGREYRS